jgi:hypothetical protein
MMQMNLIKTPQQYFQIVETGKLESAFEGEMNELLLIKSENERLSEGEQVLVSPLDQHKTHIMEHRAVLADPDLRNDPGLVKVVMDHIENHVNALRNTDPALLQMVGEQPLPPIQGQPQDQGPQGQQPQGPTHGNDQNPEVLSPVAGQQVNQASDISGPGVKEINLPNLPHPPAPFKNLPVTAEQMAPPTTR